MTDAYSAAKQNPRLQARIPRVVPGNFLLAQLAFLAVCERWGVEVPFGCALRCFPFQTARICTTNGTRPFVRLPSPLWGVICIQLFCRRHNDGRLAAAL